MRSFIEHFAADYREATGERLVVTSLVRPLSLQPRNAHLLSVHPAGMAVDLRVPADSSNRAYLERSLLALEQQGVLDATREHTPPHYHIAVFGERYGPYAAQLDSAAAAKRAESLALAKAAEAAKPALEPSATPSTTPDGSTLPPLLLNVVALAGMTAPAVVRRRRARRGRRER